MNSVWIALTHFTQCTSPTKHIKYIIKMSRNVWSRLIFPKCCSLLRNRFTGLVTQRFSPPAGHRQRLRSRLKVLKPKSNGQIWLLDFAQRVFFWVISFFCFSTKKTALWSDLEGLPNYLGVTTWCYNTSLNIVCLSVCLSVNLPFSFFNSVACLNIQQSVWLNYLYHLEWKKASRY